MRQEIIDFINGFSESIIRGINNEQKYGIDEYIEKLKTKLFVIGISITIVSTGVFMTIWGITSYIDQIFAIQGIGFILVGIIAILTGILIYKVRSANINNR